MKILMIVHSYYPSDPRVRREAEALRDRGDKVDIICLREKGERRQETVSGIKVYRLSVKRHRGSGFITYLLEYLSFSSLATLKTTLLFFRNRYQVIQIHTLPDFLVFCSLVPKFFGSSIILDMHEVTPEFFKYRYRLKETHRVAGIVKVIEKISTWFADHIITVSDTLKEILVSRGVPPDKITIIMNVADERIFKRADNHSPVLPDSFALYYHGLLSDIYDLTIVIKSLAFLKDKIKGLRFMIIGKGPEESNYQNLVRQLGLSDIVSFYGYVSQEKAVQLINNADIGIVPLAANEFTQIAFPTKIVEYIAMGIPVITANRKTIKRYFNDDSLAFYETDNELSLAEQIYKLYQHPEIRNNLAKKALECYKNISWDKMKDRYYQLMDATLRSK